MAPHSHRFYCTAEFKVLSSAIVSTIVLTYGSMELLIASDLQGADAEPPCYHSLLANYTVPAAVLKTEVFGKLLRDGRIKRRKCRRTVVNLLLFHNEVDLLEIRLQELGRAVDHFVVVESSRNFRMRERRLLLEPLLDTPRFRPFQKKLIYGRNTDHPDFPDDVEPGVVRVALHRIFMDALMTTFTTSLPRIDEDTLVLFTSADEIPSASVINFLSHHDGLPDVISFRYAKSIYSFSVAHVQRMSTERAACTWQFLRDDLFVSLDRLRFAYTRAAEQSTVGTTSQPAGWHCSWCLGLSGVVDKIASEPDAVDSAVDATFAARMMKQGRHYNGTLVASGKSRFGLPMFVRDNRERFESTIIAF
ncbi:hypothetical protein V5799_002889 [Amblyomma americanum]|uniref:Beta-1,4-mannosyl-glycoprotein 4-beta-N-acetylglucosaminyltransferase n=1 Tax=Amblyomma americanum TaxID=6943 RepID=A0AAQ4DAJ0_AMBAM